MDISDLFRPDMGYPKNKKDLSIWYIHGLTWDNQRYPWYFSNCWCKPGISQVYAKTRQFIDRLRIPNGKLICTFTKFNI